MLVLQEHRALCSEPPGELMVCFGIERLIWCLDEPGQFEHPPHAVVDSGFRQFAVVNRLDDMRVAAATAARHFQVESGTEGGDPVVDRAPVRHDDAAEPPFLAEDLT